MHNGSLPRKLEDPLEGGVSAASRFTAFSGRTVFDSTLRVGFAPDRGCAAIRYRLGLHACKFMALNAISEGIRQ
jgi:hypothetical protein